MIPPVLRRSARAASALLALCLAAPGPAASQPSRAKAFLLSLALPGAGEWYAGSRPAAAAFFGAECALWGALAGFRGYGAARETDYRLYAAGHAGVDLSGKDHAYFVNIEEYADLAAYNAAMLRGRDVEALYPEGRGFEWRWDSDAARARFERMRGQSDRARRNAMFAAGGLVLNRLVSGIDAIRVAKRRSGAPRGAGVSVGMAALPGGGGGVWLVKRF
jgi:hypothetical protein